MHWRSLEASGWWFKPRAIGNEDLPPLSHPSAETPRQVPPNLYVGPYPQCEEDVLTLQEAGTTRHLLYLHYYSRAWS